MKLYSDTGLYSDTAVSIFEICLNQGFRSSCKILECLAFGGTYISAHRLILDSCYNPSPTKTQPSRAKFLSILKLNFELGFGTTPT